MVREHANNEGRRLPCSTTPENCDFSGNAGHIDENSTPEEVAEFNRRAEETAEKYVLGDSTKTSFLGTTQRKPDRPNNDELVELSDYTLGEAREREITMDRMAMNHNDIFDVRKRNNGKWSPAVSPDSKSSFSDIGIAKEKYTHAKNDYNKTLAKYPENAHPTLDFEESDRITYQNYNIAKKELDKARTQHREEVNDRKKRHLLRLINGEVEPKGKSERDAIKNYRMKEGRKRAEKWMKRDERPEYIASIESKHFTPEGHGSKFTETKSPAEVIGLANIQRNGLGGDDREQLIEAGADPNSFLPPDSGVRYLMVKTPGTESVIDTSTMHEDETITVVAKGRNDGKPPSLSFVADVQEQPTTDVGTIIVGPDTDQDGNPIPKSEILWTMHPGSPTRGIRSDTVREQGLGDGDTLTVKEFREKFGRDIKANTRLTD